MSKHTHSDDKLERLLGDVMRDLPARQAPDTLQPRVLGELARRAALRWWQRSFAHWPTLPRAAFVAVCLGLAVFTLLGGLVAFGGVRSLNEVGTMLLSLVHPAVVIAASAGGLATVLLRVIPPLWLYGGLAVGAALYVILFGLGATAYRTLYLRPSLTGDSP